MSKVQEYRAEIEEILSGRSSKKALIVGPCSIHDPSEAYAYAQKLAEVKEAVYDKILIVMRVFFEKPRTTNDWRGFLHDPDLDGTLDLEKGIKQTRWICEKLCEMGIPLATEFIDPNLAPLFSEYISWGFIGARTTRSPIHRQLASSLDMPIGFKNPLDGDLDAVIQAIDVASSSHVAFFANEHLNLELKKTKGNPNCHGVLRGSKNGSNIDDALKLDCPLIIDCAHGNSQKTISGMIEAYHKAKHLAFSTDHVKGIMLESYLECGQQKISSVLEPGISVTDPCLSFEITEDLVLDFYKLLSQSHGSSSEVTGSSFTSISSSET